MSDQGSDIELKQVKREKEKVLKKAKKFVYPVGVTRKRISYISSVIFIVFVVIFTTISASLVYVFKDDSEFTYQINRIIPFPIGRVGSTFVTYEDYLFEYRDDEHFLREYGDYDPNSSEFKRQLNELKKAAEKRVYANALAQNLAKDKNIKIDNTELEARLNNLKAQARGGETEGQEIPSSDHGNPRFEEIIMQYYGWTLSDLERDLRMQLLKTKLVVAIDTKTKEEAESVQKQAVKQPKRFASLAKQYSDDEKTATRGGSIGVLNEKNIHIYPSEFVKKANNLQDGEVSGVIQTDYGLHIIKRDSTKSGQPVISHILFQFRTPNEVLDELVANNQSIKRFINLN